MKCARSQLRLTILAFFAATTGSLAQTDSSPLLDGHPRESYSDVADIDAMESALRTHLAAQERYSFSRSWWQWDRLRARFVDHGRKDRNALKILRAVFRGLIMDRHARLKERGEGDLLYLFHTTLRGDKRESILGVDDRRVFRDLHGGGYHGGWGGAARLRIYEELAAQGMLTDRETARFREIVHQSLETTFIDFTAKAQTANNHSFGNAGGIALALKLFPKNAPQADEARAWLDRIWNHFADFGDWTEWTYYPYGPIFLHGMLDIAEATGRVEKERDLIRSVGNRCLGFVHGGGVRGNPNSGSPKRDDVSAVYADPWDVGYYNVETSARDGHFWYRMAQHYRDPEYLWAAEQVLLGGRAPSGSAPKAYVDAYKRRFTWFIERGIDPKVPARTAAVGLLSPAKKKIPERIYLNPNCDSGSPFASFFLHDEKDEHLDNLAGFLYEYAANGAKFLHCSGKYNNVYSKVNEPIGGGSGEESLDLLLVLHKRHPFPIHPDRKGDERDPLRRGMAKRDSSAVLVRSNAEGDSFGQFAFDDYYGNGSRWIRRSVLTKEGHLVVADEYSGGESLRDDYFAGPVWHLAANEDTKPGPQEPNWFDAPSFDQAWWQKTQQRILLYFHPDEQLQYGSIIQSTSQDLGGSNTATYACRPIRAGRPERFLSVLVPHAATISGREQASAIKTEISESGEFVVISDAIDVRIGADSWSVSRN